MGRPPDSLFLVFKCPYCGAKSKYIGYEFRTGLKNSVPEFPPSFSFCPACGFAIGFRDKPRQIPFESNESWEARLVEYVIGYRPSDEFDHQALALPSLSIELPHSILQLNKFKPDIECVIRKRFWQDYTSALIYSNYTNDLFPIRIGKWVALKEQVITFLQQLRRTWKKEEKPISSSSLTLVRFEDTIMEMRSALEYWKVNQCSDVFYQKYESVIIKEAEKLLNSIRVVVDEQEIKSVQGQLTAFYQVSMFAIKVESTHSLNEYMNAYKCDQSIPRSGFEKVSDSLKNTQGQFDSVVAKLLNTLSQFQSPQTTLSHTVSLLGGDIKKVREFIRKELHPKQEENNSNLERLLQLAIRDADRLEIYQQLGKFKEAEELFENLMKTPPLSDRLLPYQRFYNEEMRKRIKRRNKRAFIVISSFMSRNKKKETKSNLEGMLSAKVDESSKLNVYQQLGRFKEAEELLNRIMSGMFMSTSKTTSHDRYYHEELGKRIRKKNKTPFVLEDAFIVLEV
jgi:tetratricopeptide (TPR) repeat protein